MDRSRARFLTLGFILGYWVWVFSLSFATIMKKIQAPFTHLVSYVDAKTTFSFVLHVST